MKSVKQRSREFRERQKAAKIAPGDRMAGRYDQPFFEFYRSSANTAQFEIPLRLANIEPPQFEDDSPAVFPSDLDGLDLPTASDSIGRAELIVGCLLDAAGGLASIINEHKRAAIKKRLDVVALTQPTDEAHRQQIVSEVKDLIDMEQQLEKQVRWSLPQWKA